MSKQFDPYYQWLKIPPSEQPPNHYRLLNTARFESNPEVIEKAVARLVAKLQSLSTGSYVEDAQRLLNDVAKARLCLTNPERKQEYDERLRQQLAEKMRMPSSKPIPSNRGNAVSVQSRGGPNKVKSATDKPAASRQRAASHKKAKSSKQPKSSAGLLFGYGVTILVVASVAVFFLFQQISGTVSNQKLVAGDSGQVPFREPMVSNVESDERSGGQVAGSETPAQSEFLDDSSGEDEQPAKQDEVQTVLSQNGEPDPPSAPIEEPDVDESSIEMPAEEEGATEGADADSGDEFRLEPGDLENFEELLGEFVEFEGTVVSANSSRSGKTRYIRFSQDWSETIMVFMLTRDVGDDLTLDNLKSLTGKKIRVSGVVEREFGSKRLGVKIRAKDQVESVED